MTRHAWNDNNYEGKLLRRAITKLAKRLSKEENVDEMIKITHAIAAAANAKKGLASYEYQDKQIAEIKRLIRNNEFVKINTEALHDSRELPG